MNGTRNSTYVVESFARGRTWTRKKFRLFLLKVEGADVMVAKTGLLSWNYR
jgi:hypothetical protein